MCLLLFNLLFRLVGDDQQIADMPELPVVQSDPFHHQIFGLIQKVGVIIPGIPYAIEIVYERETECFLLLNLIKDFLGNSRIPEQIDTQQLFTGRAEDLSVGIVYIDQATFRIV